MSLTLHTYTGHTVPAVTDARLYNKLIAGKSGIVEGVDPTAAGGLVVHVTDGWLIICGRLITVEAEDITVTAATSGSKGGRLMIRIDTSDSTNPISWKSVAAGNSYTPVQEDINGSGTVYEFTVATYTVTQVSVENVSKGTEINIIPATASDISTLNSAISALQQRVTNLEARQNITVSVSGTTATITTA